MIRKIRNRFVLNNIFGFLKHNIKLKLLQFNKSLQKNVNIFKRDYEMYIPLKKFRTEFKVNITDLKIKNIDLRNKILENSKKELLTEIDFKELEELNLSENKNFDINILENVKSEKIKVLNLNLDEIKDINVLTKVKFRCLNELYLYNNKIENIIPLLGEIFSELKILDLYQNKISNIQVLENAKFEKLEV